MIPMKLLFVICICSFELQQITAPDVLERRSSFYNLLRSISTFTLKETLPQRKIEISTSDAEQQTIPHNIQIQETKPIDLTPLTPNTFEYHKNAVLLFSRIINKKFFYGQYPKEISNLVHELENLQESGSSTSSNNKIEVTHENTESQTELTKQSPSSSGPDKLMEITEDLLKKYHVLIETYTYEDQAFYFNALQWLKENVTLNTSSKVHIKTITDHKKKARNYIYEFVSSEKLKEFYDFAADKWKKSNGWKEDEYSIALSFIDDMFISRGAAAKNVSIRCQDIEIYEKILISCNEKLFKDVMKMTVQSALEVIDNSFKNKCELDPSMPSLFKPAIPTKDINLKEMTRGSVRYYKHVAILFVETLKNILSQPSISILSEEDLKILDNFPERDDPNNVLRYCEFQYWFSEVIPRMKPAFQKIKEEDFLFRSKIFRVFDWFLIQLAEDNQNAGFCPFIRDALNLFVVEKKLQHPMEALIKKENNRLVCFPESRSASTLEELMTLGDREDRALNSFLLVTGYQIEEDKKNVSEEANKKESMNLRRSMQLTSFSKNLWEASKNLDNQGKLSPDFQCDTIEYFQSIINKMEKKLFGIMFFREPEEFFSRLKIEWEKRCQTHELPIEILWQNIEENPLDPPTTQTVEHPKAEDGNE